MIKYQLEQRCQQVIAEATARMADAPSVKMREKWRLIREAWEKLLQKAQATTRDDQA